MGSNVKTFAPELAAAPPLPARAEYLEHQDRARAALAGAELDGLLAFGSRNWPWAVRWLADYQSGFPPLRRSTKWATRRSSCRSRASRSC